VVDGKYQKRIRINGNSDQPIILNVSTEGKHTVWIYKETEATTGPIFIDKVVAKNIRSLSNPVLPLIEFIGNSITCGACADVSEVPCGTGEYHDQHNAYYAYGPRVARALNVNFILSSVSGIGIYRNWNSNGPTMPQVYENAELDEQNSHRWNFKLYDPKIVSIALGTNDYSNGDGKRERLPFDSAIFVSTYIKFVRLVRSKYPKAKIALLSSPMINGDTRITLQNCLTAVKINVDKLYRRDKPIALFFFKPMRARGCSGHPSVEDHAILANELTPFFKKLLK
jgi:lysophospholipase L1-like esterase